MKFTRSGGGEFLGRRNHRCCRASALERYGYWSWNDPLYNRCEIRLFTSKPWPRSRYLVISVIVNLFFRYRQDLLDEDVNSLVEEEDCVGCPLPSTPEDENLLDNEVSSLSFERRWLLTNFFFFRCRTSWKLRSWATSWIWLRWRITRPGRRSTSFGRWWNRYLFT